MIIIFMLLIGILCFMILSTQTLYLHPKPYKNIFSIRYSNNHDLWLKKKGNKNLIIMLHGMYASPSTFLECGEKIVEIGWDVYMPVLPNSANSLEDLLAQGCFQWEDSLKVCFQKSLIFNDNYKKIVLCGYSQGGALAMSIAPSLNFLKGLIIVAAPLSLIHKKNKLLKNIGIALSGFLYFFLRKKGLLIKSKKNSQDENNKPDFYYAMTLHSMNLGLKIMKKNLSSITVPCLFAYEQEDLIVNFDDFNKIKNNISSSRIKEIIFNSEDEKSDSNKHRLFNYKSTKEKLCHEIISFLRTL